MSGYFFIVAILILGGVIATVGDKIGSKVGKARLSVFNLRPRNTATLVTIVTGGIISSSTLVILLATNEQLRDGLFRLGEIRKDLDRTQMEKQAAQGELKVATEQKRSAQRELNRINLSLQEALTRQSETEAQLQQSQTNLQALQTELSQIQTQETELLDRVQRLDGEQQTLTEERDRLSGDLAKITTETSKLRQQVQDSEERLMGLTSQQTTLTREIQNLEQTKDMLARSIDTLRQGGVRITRDQVLAAVVVPTNLSRQEQRQSVLQLLQLADQNARRELDFPDNTPIILSVTTEDIDRIITRLQAEKERNRRLSPSERSDSFIVRIRSAENYLRKERNIAIRADIDRNRLIFARGATIVTLPFSPNMTDPELEEQFDRLFGLVRFRVVQEGVIPNPETGEIGRFGGSLLQSSTNLVQLFNEAKQRNNPFEIRAIAKADIYRASSLSRQLAAIELVIIENGQEVARFG